MAVVITVMNMKGGVGKSTVAMHVGGALALQPRPTDGKSRRVLLIDYDPQFNLSQAFIGAASYFALEKAQKTVLSVLQEDPTQLDPFSIQIPGSMKPPAVSALARRCLNAKAGGYLDLVPSTLDLMYIAVGSASGSVATIESRFAKFITDARSHYDVILIDCHPAGSILTKTSLSNSDDVLIPVVAHQYAARGISLMKTFIDAVRPMAPPRIHVLFNLTARTGVSRIETQLRADPHFSAHCLTKTLHRYQAFADPHEGNGFVWSSKKPYSTEAFRNVAHVAAEFSTRVLASQGV